MSHRNLSLPSEEFSVPKPMLEFPQQKENRQENGGERPTNGDGTAKLICSGIDMNQRCVF